MRYHAGILHVTNVKDNVKDELLTLTSTADYSDQITFPASWLTTPEYIEQNRDVAYFGEL